VDRRRALRAILREIDRLTTVRLEVLRPRVRAQVGPDLRRALEQLEQIDVDDLIDEVLFECFEYVSLIGVEALLAVAAVNRLRDRVRRAGVHRARYPVGETQDIAQAVVDDPPTVEPEVEADVEPDAEGVVEEIVRGDPVLQGLLQAWRVDPTLTIKAASARNGHTDRTARLHFAKARRAYAQGDRVRG
jgi:DNA-directed RNA polymerase specialized sigma24 family protein